MDLIQQKKAPKFVSFKENIIPTLSSLKCFFCSKKLSQQYSLKRHYSTVHMDKLPVGCFKNMHYRCEICNKTYSRHDQFNEHLQNSKEHKQAVESRTNCKGSIDQLLSNQSTKRPQPSQDIDDDVECAENSKRQRTDSFITIVLDKENDDPAVKNQSTGDSEIQSHEKQIPSVDDESDDDVIVLERLDPMTDQLEKLDKERLLAIKSYFRETYAKIQKQYELVNHHLKKFE